MAVMEMICDKICCSYLTAKVAKFYAKFANNMPLFKSTLYLLTVSIDGTRMTQIEQFLDNFKDSPDF